MHRLTLHTEARFTMDIKNCDDKKLAENCLPLIKQNLFRVNKDLQQQKRPKKLKTSCLMVNIAVLSVSLMTLIIFWFTNIYNRLLLEKIILEDGSEMLEYWIKPPFDPLIKVYVFNYTNILDVLNGNETIIKLKEVGPFVYMERVQKIGLKFDGHEITFHENRTHTFLPHLSGNLTEDDILTVPNIPLISGIPNARSLGFFAEFGFRTILGTTKPKQFQNISVSKYFHGYTDEYMNLVKVVKWGFNPKDVGILAPRRGVTKKTVTVCSGTGNVNDVGRVVAVDGKTQLDIWKSESCNQITGSDGVIYGPNLVQNKKDLQVYLTNLCRSLPLVFDKEEKVLNGMRSYRYKAPFGSFSSTETFPENKFYCELKSVTERHIDGVLDVSGCIDGNPPIFISHPHFMEGDSELFKHFEGLKPDLKFHESFANIHPRLSVPIFGVSRMQVNLKVNHFGKYYKNIPDGLILPLVWIETTTEEFPDHVKRRLFLSTVVVDYLEIFFKFGSFLCFITAFFILIFNQTCTFKNVAMWIRDHIRPSSSTI